MNIKLNLKLDKVAKPLSAALQFLAEHMFLASLILILIASLFGAAIFYKYYIAVRDVEPELRIEPVKFQEQSYQKIMEEWRNRDEKFEQALNRGYPDLLKQLTGE